VGGRVCSKPTAAPALRKPLAAGLDRFTTKKHTMADESWDVWDDGPFAWLRSRGFLIAIAIVAGVVVLYCVNLWLEKSSTQNFSEDPAAVGRALDQMMTVRLPAGFEPANTVHVAVRDVDLAWVTYRNSKGDAQLVFLELSAPMELGADPKQWAYAALIGPTGDPQPPLGKPTTTRPVKIRGRQCNLELSEAPAPKGKKQRRIFVTFPGRSGQAAFLLSYSGDSMNQDEIVKMLEAIE
jgi:hypothetical protein